MAAVDFATSSGRTNSGSGMDPLAPRNAGTAAPADLTGQMVVKRWKDGGDELLKQRRDHWQNLSMFFGEQWVWWDKTRNLLQSLPQAWSPLGRGRARTVSNRIRPNLQSLLGRMLRVELEFDVAPTDSGDDVVSGAMLAEDVLTASHHDQDWRSVRFEENFAKFIGGTSAVCVEWDQAAGTPIGKVDSTDKIIGTGEAKLTALSISEFCVQPGVRDARKAAWWIMGLAVAPDVAKDQYGLNWTPGADASTLMSPLQQRLLEQMGRGKGVNHLCLVLVMYERPNNANKQGKYAVVINGRTVVEKAWPFAIRDRLNLFVFRQQQVEGTWIGTTCINDAVPIQVAYNFMRSTIAEHAKKVGNARIMATQGSFMEEDLTDDPGSVLWYTPDLGGAPPQYMRPPDLPRWMVGEAGALSAELDDVMYVHATSRGEASFDRASGQALALLAEKDDSPLGLMAFEESQRWSEIGEWVLKLYEAKVTETRVVQVQPRTGSSGQVRISRWNGKALKGQTRCLVPLETTMPMSDAALQAFAKDLWDRRLITDPIQYARLTRVPQRHLMDIIDADVAKAQRENAEMTLDDAPHPDLFDDHAKHIAEHNRFRKSDSYRYASQEVRQVVDYHITYHQQMAAEQLGEQTQLAQLNPALAGLPQANEPAGSQVPTDYAEQQAGMPPMPGQMPGEAAPTSGQAALGAGAPQGPPNAQGSVAIAAGAGAGK